MKYELTAGTTPVDDIIREIIAFPLQNQKVVQTENGALKVVPIK